MTHIQQRRDQSAVWTSVNPVLFDGEMGHESDTGKSKLGDGVTAWNSLPYQFGVNSVAGKVGNVTLAVADVSGAAPVASPTFTGDPKAPTPATSDNDTSIATTAYVKAQLVSPVFTGDPKAPTPIKTDNDTSIATTKFVKDQAYAPLNDPEFTGVPKAPTPAANSDNTLLATTAFVKTALATVGPAWTDFTPSATGEAGQTITAYTSLGRYQRIGKTIHFTVQVSVTNAGALNNGLNVSLPFASREGVPFIYVGRETQATGIILQAILNPGLAYITVYGYANGPVMASGRTYLFTGTYETD